MEAIKERRGGRRPGAGRKKKPSTQIKDAIDSININEIFEKLELWAKGEPVKCPYCGKDTGKFTADNVALESAKELLNRRLGKSVQRQELDVNVNVTQIATVYREALTEAEGEYKEIIEGETKLIDS